MNLNDDIRIGTLVSAEDKAAYIRQILSYGFESFSLTWWENLGNTDLERTADAVNKVLDGSGIAISSLSVFGNLLENDEKAEISRRDFKRVVAAAANFGVDTVTGFTGRLRGRTVPESLERFREIWTPLVEFAGEHGLRIAWENCPMEGNWQSGDWNIAFCPDAWELMFAALPLKNCGLQWEPCHQMFQLIDPLPQIRAWKDRIFLLHGKDATIRHEVIRQCGIGGSEPFVLPRTPGFGDTNWTDIISELRLVGFHGAIDIEGWHDPVYRDELEMTGQIHALNYLKQCRGGTFVPNP